MTPSCCVGHGVSLAICPSASRRFCPIFSHYFSPREAVGASRKLLPIWGLILGICIVNFARRSPRELPPLFEAAEAFSSVTMLCEDRTKVALGRIRAMSFIAQSPPACEGMKTASSSSTGWKPPDQRRAPLRQRVLLFGADSDESETDSISTAQSTEEEAVPHPPTSPYTASHRPADAQKILSPLARPLLQFDTPGENGTQDGVKAGMLARKGLKRRMSDMLAGCDANSSSDSEPAPRQLNISPDVFAPKPVRCAPSPLV